MREVQNIILVKNAESRRGVLCMLLITEQDIIRHFNAVNLNEQYLPYRCHKSAGAGSAVNVAEYIRKNIEKPGLRLS